MAGWNRNQKHMYSQIDQTDTRPVPGYEGRYEVSSDGLVYSVRRLCIYKDGRTKIVHARVLRPHYNELGYAAVSLWRDGAGRTIAVHRLVAMAFHGIPAQSNLDVRHLDGNPKNNHKENLQWGTRMENVQDCIRHGRFRTACGEDAGLAKLSRKQAMKIREAMDACNNIPRRRLAMALAKRYKVGESTIDGIYYRRTWSRVLDNHKN